MCERAGEEGSVRAGDEGGGCAGEEESKHAGEEEGEHAGDEGGASAPQTREVVAPGRREVSVPGRSAEHSRYIDIGNQVVTRLWVTIWLIVSHACSSPTYFTAKSSTHSTKKIGRQSCFQKPGVIVLCRYPAAFSRFSRSSCAMIPAWGRPYIPLLIWTYT